MGLGPFIPAGYCFLLFFLFLVFFCFLFCCLFWLLFSTVFSFPSIFCFLFYCLFWLLFSTVFLLFFLFLVYLGEGLSSVYNWWLGPRQKGVGALSGEAILSRLVARAGTEGRGPYPEREKSLFSVFSFPSIFCFLWHDPG